MDDKRPLLDYVPVNLRWSNMEESHLNAQFSLERRLAYRFSILSTLNVRCLGSVYAKKFGLSTAGWRIMSIIGRYEPIFPGVAAQRSTMDADKVTRAVDRLVDMGYVIRNTDAADRRRVILCLTSRGRTVYDEVEEMHRDMDAQWRVALDKEENAALDSILDKLETKAHVLFSDATGEQLVKAVRTPRRAAAKTPAAKTSASAGKAPAAARKKTAAR